MLDEGTLAPHLLFDFASVRSLLGRWYLLWELRTVSAYNASSTGVLVAANALNVVISQLLQVVYSYG